MGKLKIQPITNDMQVLSDTIVEMMGVPALKSFDIATLLDATTKFPFSSQVTYDKIFGRWIFTNEDEDNWPKEDVTYNVSGPNFTFAESSPELALIKGIHYYYHTKIKQ